MIGQESLLIGCSEMLLERGHEIRAVVSRDADILAWARGKGLPTTGAISDLAETFDPDGFDWLLSLANLSVIPEAVLALPARGAVNFHDGPLPEHAGLNCPVWALMAGDTAYGVTWHLIEGGIDEGDILAQERFDIVPDETALSLNSKCYAAGMDSFPQVLDQLETGLQRQPQELPHRAYHGRDSRPPAGGVLDLARPAGVVSAQIRALDFGGYWNPVTCAKLRIGADILRVTSVQGAATTGALPGTVLDVGDRVLTVETGDGALRLEGVTRLDGSAVDLTGLTRPGDRLVPPDAQEATALDAALAATQRAEPHWRRMLRDRHPLPLPLAAGKASGDWAVQRISVPHGLSRAQMAAATLLWALHTSGEDHGDLALASAGVRAAHGLTSDWVPLRARDDAPLGALQMRAEADLAKAAELGGFARDLVARDPGIELRGTPPIGLALDGAGPVPGSLATVVLSDGRMALHVDSGALDTDAGELLALRLERALQAVAGAAEDTTPDRLDLLPEAERATVLTNWNDTARDYDRGETVHGAFEAQAARMPDAPALVFAEQAFSYGALDARANAIAARLRAMGVQPGVHVGLYCPRGPEMVAAALAILKAGGAYVPLDPDYPADRIAHYITDSRAGVIVTEAALRTALPAGDAQVLQLEEVAASDVAVDGGASADDLAYLIYTSGSTGTPKGVMVEHRNVMNFFAGMDDRIDHAPGDCWLAVTSLNFDISVLEIFWTLARGFKVVLSSDENRAAISNGPIAVSDRHIDFNLMYWGNDDGPGPKKYELLLEGAKFAAAHGFNAVWTPERHFHAFGGPYPNPAVTGAAVAAVAPGLAVRAGSCVAPLHHPARIAEDWAVIDNLTGGKTGIGFASGWQPDDFVLRPENAPPNNKPAMFEALETVRKLWRGEKVGFPRADGSIHEVVTQPRPVSKELNVWVTTAGNPETWKEAGRVGANVLTHLLGQSVDEVGEKIRLYHAALREAGHDPADHRVTLMLHSYLADSREAAREVAREPMKDYLRSAAGLIKQYAWAFPAFKKPKGVSNPFEMDLGALSEEELEAILDFAFERYFEDSGLFGTVEDGLARVEQLKRIGVDEVACLIDYGIAPDLVLEGLKPLAQVLERANAPSALAEDDFSLAAQIIRHGVTHLQCTPSMARIIAMNDEARMALRRVRHLVLGGEALPGELVSDLREATAARVLNMYGPTETTIWSTCQQVGPTEPGIVGIGTPIANTSVYVLDPGGRICPVGVAGELCIGGEGVTRGYWQRAELTDTRFPPDPFAEAAGLAVTAAPRMYRTGDLVRWRMDGTLDFLGRTDHQVKIRGQRIELGEIEAALAVQPGVTGAVVVPREISGDARLVGYVTAGAPVDEADLRAALAATLPEVMVPAHVVTLDAFPLTPNKKIDRKALPDPAPARAEPAAAGPAPTGIEGEIAAIWTRILGVGAIRAEDNFFALGGHSLLAVQAHRQIRETLQRPDLSITDIFRFPTLGGLAGHLSGAETAKPEPEIAEPQRAETMSRRRAMRASRKERAR
ncbi:hypothetical protein GCM10010973_08870 [Cribrihabitans marinus]|nr:hypothetical protein GCM10010973_08870 [Cribrihabitans marinus]